MTLQGWSVAGKAWVGLIGSLLTFAVPTVASVSETLPEPWPAVIAAIVAVLTALGVYQAPYAAPTDSAGGDDGSSPWPTN